MIQVSDITNSYIMYVITKMIGTNLVRTKYGANTRKVPMRFEYLIVKYKTDCKIRYQYSD